MTGVLEAIEALSDERLKAKCTKAIALIERCIAIFGYVARGGGGGEGEGEGVADLPAWP